mmetsp:Transcript_43170/g.92088  ORF Transcript_43170/g.92088 Transcript_43170/m.92088 type:complete len:227 (-) Transcript_43170:623-1303(-)
MPHRGDRRAGALLRVQTRLTCILVAQEAGLVLQGEKHRVLNDKVLNSSNNNINNNKDAFRDNINDAVHTVDNYDNALDGNNHTVDSHNDVESNDHIYDSRALRLRLWSHQLVGFMESGKEQMVLSASEARMSNDTAANDYILPIQLQRGSCKLVDCVEIIEANLVLPPQEFRLSNDILTLRLSCCRLCLVSREDSVVLLSSGPWVRDDNGGSGKDQDPGLCLQLLR